MVVDGKLYPSHLAVSNHWNVHYFSARMGIAESLALDYAGIDFGISPDGDVVVFEANAAMTVFMPEASPETEYRRRAALRIFEAAREMILARAMPR